MLLKTTHVVNSFGNVGEETESVEFRQSMDILQSLKKRQFDEVIKIA